MAELSSVLTATLRRQEKHINATSKEAEETLKQKRNLKHLEKDNYLSRISYNLSVFQCQSLVVTLVTYYSCKER